MEGTLRRRRMIMKSTAGTVVGNLNFDDFYNLPAWIRSTLDNLINAKVLRYGSKGRLKPAIRPRGIRSPWFYIKAPTNRKCFLWGDIYCDNFKIIPTGCRECYKVVIVTNEDPEWQTVLDLFRLRDFMLSLGSPGKCGVDFRLHTSNRYSGFIYADGVEQGRQYHKLVSERIKNIIPDAKIILKRGCTEFEHTYGESDKWDQLALERGWDGIQHYLDYMIETYDVPSQDALLHHQESTTFQYWIEYAQAIGDHSWKDALRSQGYDPPEHLFFPPVTYHEEE